MQHDHKRGRGFCCPRGPCATPEGKSGLDSLLLNRAPSLQTCQADCYSTIQFPVSRQKPGWTPVGNGARVTCLPLEPLSVRFDFSERRYLRSYTRCQEICGKPLLRKSAQLGNPDCMCGEASYSPRRSSLPCPTGPSCELSELSAPPVLSPRVLSQDAQHSVAYHSLAVRDFLFL